MYDSTTITYRKRDTQTFMLLEVMAMASNSVHNEALALLRNAYAKNLTFLTENEVNKILRGHADEFIRCTSGEEKYGCYRRLQANVAVYAANGAVDAMKSFEVVSKFDPRAELPEFKKKGGWNTLFFQDCAFSLSKDKKDILLSTGKLLQKELGGHCRNLRARIKIPPNVNPAKIKCVRVIPDKTLRDFRIEFLSLAEFIPENNGTNFAGGDIGMEAFIAIAFKDGQQPLIIDGSEQVKILDDARNELIKITEEKRRNNVYHLTKREARVYRKLNNKKLDFNRKASKAILEKSKENGVSKIVIGHNKGMKSGSNMGQKTNWTFNQMAHFSKFVTLITHQGKKTGITVLETEENHTSKTSVLDEETPNHHETYLGKRKGRKFTTKDKIEVHADINAAANMLIKASDKLKIKKEAIYASIKQGLLLSPLILYHSKDFRVTVDKNSISGSL